MDTSDRYIIPRRTISGSRAEVIAELSRVIQDLTIARDLLREGHHVVVMEAAPWWRRLNRIFRVIGPAMIFLAIVGGTFRA